MNEEKDEILRDLINLIPGPKRKEAQGILMEYEEKIIDSTFKHIEKHIETAKHFRRHI